MIFDFYEQKYLEKKYLKLNLEQSTKLERSNKSLLENQKYRKSKKENQEIVLDYLNLHILLNLKPSVMINPLRPSVIFKGR